MAYGTQTHTFYFPTSLLRCIHFQQKNIPNASGAVFELFQFIQCRKIILQLIDCTRAVIHVCKCTRFLSFIIITALICTLGYKCLEVWCDGTGRKVTFKIDPFCSNTVIVVGGCGGGGDCGIYDEQKERIKTGVKRYEVHHCTTRVIIHSENKQV